ncbi:hypothetical protein DAPPUDRAFT_243498 [Daphnia pulex]|uniref:Uncharacterized protein n=1 Tax=Daphnia pulex TaxID=6669 RepID=E9GIZ0_DAPPU|nr:hypothetical protein DAPPUDRAFT_243498 [Daphnia pulex]|eukprot:EFX80572.1 hypothetical protein DAPPUDRAFT_243498 [Daphnia pulex]
MKWTTRLNTVFSHSTGATNGSSSTLKSDLQFNSTADAEWSWVRELICPFNADSPMICFPVASNSKLERYFVAGSDKRYPIGRLIYYQCGPSSSPVNPVEQIASQPGTFLGYSMKIGGMLYAVGGRENSPDALGHSGYVNAYDPVTSTWH